MQANQILFSTLVWVVVNGGFWCGGRKVINRAPEACTADSSSSNLAVIVQQLWVSIWIDIWRCTPPVIAPLFLAARVSYRTLLVTGCLASGTCHNVYIIFMTAVKRLYTGDSCGAKT